MKILIVDDNVDMRIMLRDVCSNYFEIIDECSNGKDAVYQYEKLKPDYVLMDIKMPVLNGIDAARIIIEKDPAAKIIIITNFISSYYEEAAFAAGAVNFLSKDNISELEKILSGLT